MNRSIFRLAWVVPLALAWFASPLVAQEKERSSGYSAIIDNIDLLVENYARFVGRKYDLTDEQDQYTKHMLRERAYEFLDKHEDKVRTLVDRLFEVRTGGEMTPDELIEWGREITPVYEEARKVIVESNNEWREILTDEQRAIHDEDLKLMKQSFATTDDQLDRIVSGEMTVEEFRNPRLAQQRARQRQTARAVKKPINRENPIDRPRDFANNAEPRVMPQDRNIEPPPGDAQSHGQLGVDESRGQVRPPATLTHRPRRTQAAKTDTGSPQGENEAQTDPPVVNRRTARPERRPRPRQQPGRGATRSGTAGKTVAGNFESQWDKYVENFIAKYKLDDTQTQKAHTILKDCKTQANQHVLGRKSQIEELDRQTAAAKTSKDRNKATKLRQLNEQKQKLLAPVNHIFEQQLKPRLERIPTRTQRRNAEKPSAKPGRKRPVRKP